MVTVEDKKMSRAQGRRQWKTIMAMIEVKGEAMQQQRVGLLRSAD